MRTNPDPFRPFTSVNLALSSHAFADDLVDLLLATDPYRDRATKAEVVRDIFLSFCGDLAIARGLHLPHPVMYSQEQVRSSLHQLGVTRSGMAQDASSSAVARDAVAKAALDPAVLDRVRRRDPSVTQEQINAAWPFLTVAERLVLSSD